MQHYVLFLEWCWCRQRLVCFCLGYSQFVVLMAVGAVRLEKQTKSWSVLVTCFLNFLNGFEINQRDVTRFSVEEYRGVFFCSVNQKFNFIKNSILFLSFCFLLSVHCCQRMLLNLLLLYTTITIYIVTSPVPTGFVRTQLHSGVFSIGDWSTTLPDNINPFSIQGTKRNGRLIL